MLKDNPGQHGVPHRSDRVIIPPATAGGFEEAELVEKNLAERLWALFEELLEAVVRSIADSGAVDLPEFKRSPDYATLKALFEESFLGHQLQALDKTA